MTTAPLVRRRAPARTALAAGLAASLLAACGGRDTGAVPPVSAAATTTVVTAPPTSPPTTARPAITTAAAPTAATPVAAPNTATTVTAATVPATLPTPIMPPPEYQVEPEVIVGRISIPRLDLDEDLFQGITLPTLDKGPGYWPGTAMPGQPGNVVIAGHRTASERPFRYIERLVEGDEVTFTVDGVPHRYLVTGHEIVTPDAIRIIDQTPARTATLFACHPPGSTEFRWVVHLEHVA
jgi:sortase A